MKPIPALFVIVAGGLMLALFWLAPFRTSSTPENNTLPHPTTIDAATHSPDTILTEQPPARPLDGSIPSGSLPVEASPPPPPRHELDDALRLPRTMQPASASTASPPPAN